MKPSQSETTPSAEQHRYERAETRAWDLTPRSRELARGQKEAEPEHTLPRDSMGL